MSSAAENPTSARTNAPEPEEALAADAPRTRRWLHAILFAGLALRLLAWLFTWPTRLLNDEFDYVKQPLRWLAGGELDLIRPPLTGLLNAGVMSLLPGEEVAVRGVGALLGSALPFFVYGIARSLGGARSALAAAAITALYPPLIAYSHYALSETLFLVLALAALCWLLRSEGRHSTLQLVGIGTLCGLACLTRSTGQGFALALAVGAGWQAWRKHEQPLLPSLRSGALILATTLLVIAPWGIHLHRATGSGFSTSQTTWMNLYLGNPPTRAGMIPIAYYQKLAPTQAEREAIARTRALRNIGKRMPWWPLQKLDTLVPLFQPTSQGVKRLLVEPGQKAGGIGEWNYRYAWAPLEARWLRHGLALLSSLSYVAIAVFGALGLALSRQRIPRGIVLLVGASVVAPVLLTFANTRFRLPLEPLLIAGAALVTGEGRSLWAQASPLQRGIAAAAALAMLALLLAGGQAFMSPKHA